MSRQLQSLTPADLALLRPVVVSVGDPLLTTVTDEAHAWPRTSMEHFGLCGVAAHHGAQIAAFGLVSPCFSVPDEHPLSCAPRTADAAALLCLWVDPSFARSGWGRQVVQGLSARLVGRVGCIEATSEGATESSTCTVAPGLLGSLGFGPTEIAHRHRLNLTTTVPVRPRFERAVTTVARWVGTARPEPAGRVLPRAA